MISALWWAAMWAKSMFHSLCRAKSRTRQCPYTTIFEQKGEPKRGIEPGSFRLPAERRDSATTAEGSLNKCLQVGGYSCSVSSCYRWRAPISSVTSALFVFIVSRVGSVHSFFLNVTKHGLQRCLRGMCVIMREHLSTSTFLWILILSVGNLEKDTFTDRTLEKFAESDTCTWLCLRSPYVSTCTCVWVLVTCN